MKGEKQKIITEQDVRFFIAIAVFLIPIFLCWSSIETKLALIQQELSTIRSNDLAHIEIELTDMKSRNTVQDSRTIELGLQVQRLLTLSGLNK